MKRKSPPCGIFCCTSDLAQRARSIAFQQLKARAFPCLYYPGPASSARQRQALDTLLEGIEVLRFKPFQIRQCIVSTLRCSYQFIKLYLYRLSISILRILDQKDHLEE